MKAITIQSRCFGLLALAAMLGGCTTKSGGNAEVVKTEPTTADVVRKDLVGYAFFDGKVYIPPSAQAGVVAAVSNLPISEVMTADGRNVNRGQTLFTLAMPGDEEVLMAAENGLTSAKAALTAARTENNAPLRDAQRMLAEARAAEKAARADVQSGGSADLAAATEARIYAEEAVRAAQTDLEARVANERYAVAAASEYLADVRSGTKIYNVRAPIAGTVTSLNAKVGVIPEGKVLANIIDFGAIRVHGTVPAEHIDLVKKGTSVLIAVEGANSDPFEGVVKEISILPPAEGQNSAGYLALIDFDNSKKVVAPGTVIKRLGVKTGKTANALVVPIGAVEDGAEGKKVVYVMKGTEWTPVPVELGITDGALIEVKSGLNEGDKVRVKSVAITP